MGVINPLVGSGHLSGRTEVIEDEEHKTLSASEEDADFHVDFQDNQLSMYLVNYSLMTVYYPSTFPVDTFLVSCDLAVIHVSLSKCTKL